jgi:hypothetical protein
MEDKNYRKLRAAFEATQPQVPDDFTGRVMKRIEEQASVPPSNHRRLRWVAAAACILLLAGIGMVTLREDVSTSEQDVADQRDGVPTSKMVVAEQRDRVSTSNLVVAEQRDEVSMPKLRSQTSKKKFRKRNSLPDTLGTGIWQRRENIETALRILGECEADIERSEQQVRNHIIETTFRATPQPANVILVSDENGDYELLETKRVINI